MRKTAAICVAKLFDINPELVEDQGFISSLNDMLSDSNPMVRLSTSRVALAVAVDSVHLHAILTKVVGHRWLPMPLQR